MKTKAKKTSAKLGAQIDKLYAIRAERLKLNERINELKSDEKVLRERLLRTIPKADLSGARGAIGQANLIPEVYPKITDKDRFLKNLRKTGEFDLIVWHPNSAACKERWEAKRVIPGVMPEGFTKLSVTKVGGKK